jgi:hypothetical protein
MSLSPLLPPLSVGTTPSSLQDTSPPLDVSLPSAVEELAIQELLQQQATGVEVQWERLFSTESETDAGRPSTESALSATLAASPERDDCSVDTHAARKPAVTEKATVSELLQLNMIQQILEGMFSNEGEFPAPALAQDDGALSPPPEGLNYVVLPPTDEEIQRIGLTENHDKAVPPFIDSSQPLPATYDPLKEYLVSNTAMSAPVTVNEFLGLNGITPECMSLVEPQLTELQRHSQEFNNKFKEMITPKQQLKLKAEVAAPKIVNKHLVTEITLTNWGPSVHPQSVAENAPTMRPKRKYILLA